MQPGKYPFIAKGSVSSMQDSRNGIRRLPIGPAQNGKSGSPPTKPPRKPGHPTSRPVAIFPIVLASLLGFVIVLLTLIFVSGLTTILTSCRGFFGAAYPLANSKEEFWAFYKNIPVGGLLAAGDWIAITLFLRVIRAIGEPRIRERLSEETIVGKVSGFQIRQEPGLSFSVGPLHLNLTQTIFSFLLQRRDDLGNPLDPISVEMRAPSIRGVLNEHHEVAVPAHWHGGRTLRVALIYNRTTGGCVEATAGMASLNVLVAIAVGVLGALVTAFGQIILCW